MAMFYIFNILILFAESFWAGWIMYPASLAQIDLGIDSFYMLWAVRISAFILIILTALIIGRLTEKGKKFYWLYMGMVPVFTLVWLSYPIDALRVFISAFLFRISNKYLTNKTHALILSGLIVAFVNISVFSQKPGIVDIIDSENIKREILFRFNIEDNLKPSILIPLTIRRIAYNKLFIPIKNLGQEAITYFDLESLFFQEVHPLNQKGFVIFYWSQAILFLMSVYSIFYTTGSTIKFRQTILGLFALSFVYYLTSSGTPDRRHLFTIFAMSLLFAEGSAILIKNLKYKIAINFLILIAAYGWFSNISFRFVKPEFWLDNRPLAYDFALKTIKETEPSYTKIIVTEALYATTDYCNFYLDSCKKIVIKDFILENKLPDNDTLYVGFTKNFMGNNNLNASDSEVTKSLLSKGLKIFGSKHLTNNIADGYGQSIYVAGAKQ